MAAAIQYRLACYDVDTDDEIRATPWADLPKTSPFSVDCSMDWEWVEFREKPKRTAEEIVAELKALDLYYLSHGVLAQILDGDF